MIKKDDYYKEKGMNNLKDSTTNTVKGIFVHGISKGNSSNRHEPRNQHKSFSVHLRSSPYNADPALPFNNFSEITKTIKINKICNTPYAQAVPKSNAYSFWKMATDNGIVDVL